MRLLLLADGKVGKKIAEYLIRNYRKDIVLIVTTQKNIIYHEADINGIPVCVFESEEIILKNLIGSADLGLLAWWPTILKNKLLNAPLRGFVNLHPSFLPYNRGKHYNFWALVEQCPFGVTIHSVNSGIDTGNIISQKAIEYDWCDTGGTLYTKAQRVIIKLFKDTYFLLRKGGYETKQQDLQLGSFHYASELERASEIILDEKYKARDLLNLIRARTFKGYPGCWFKEDGYRYEISVKIKKVD